MVLDEETSKLLADLKRKRGVIKASLTRMRNFIKTFDPKVEPISLLEFRQEELPQINRKFDDVQSEIELLSTEDQDEAETEREEFEINYYAARSRIQEMINNEKGQGSSGHNVSLNNQLCTPRARLAPINLPKFSGNIQEWESFFDCFKVMVDQEDYYSPSQKFYYLRSTLSGQALDLIKGLPMTDTNYALAIEKLQKRYDNKSLIIQAHIREILKTPRVEINSAHELLKLHSHISTHVAALEALKQPIDCWDAWLVTILVERMDSTSNQEWQLRQRDTELPKYYEIMEFLSTRSIALESSEALDQSKAEKESSLSKTTSRRKFNAGNYMTNSLLTTNDNATDKCVCCSSPHKIFNCTRFKEMPISERVTFVRSARLCFNCLSPSHMANVCRSTFSCRICNRRHHWLLHFEKTISSESVQNQEEKFPEHIQSTSSQPSNTSSALSLLVRSQEKYVFLPTATVMVSDKFEVQRKCKVVLDSGSQVNFISKKLQSILQLSGERVELPVSGIGSRKVQATTKVNIQIQSRISTFTLNISCYVLPAIATTLPSCAGPPEGWGIPSEIAPQLADPQFNKASTIDLLIGAGTFFDLLEPEKVHLETNNLTLQNTRLGWVMTGELGVISLASINSIGESLEETWRALKNDEDEGYGRFSKSNQRCLEEKEALQHFNEHTTRSRDGRFVVQLPVKPLIEELGDTVKMATNRFLSVERRLQRDENLKKEYIDFMEQYIQLGHMVEVLNETKIPRRSFYMPHHAVVKDSSLTTKVRVVFDASAKSSSGHALNDVLMCGPTVQEDIFSILVRFRRHQYVLTSDVEKMFRQIQVTEKDWDLQRILWRNKPSDVLRTYRLTTVTYGTTPASFLATQCLVVLADDVKQVYPNAARVISKDFYMDDLMTGCETEEDCIKLQCEINSTFDSAKLKLRKWCSNSTNVLERIGKCETDPFFTLDIKDGDSVKSLGLGWKPLIDQFHFKIDMAQSNNKHTKRTLLSDLNRVFDPLGFLSPVLLRGKIFLQQIWAMKVEWDTQLSPDISERWSTFLHDIQNLRNLSIPRKVIPVIGDHFEIHGFCDASQEAYGACIYVRALDKNGSWSSQLLCSKTRVAPLKELTIPRLELNGALLLAELAKKVAYSWDLNLSTFRLWTDSTIVLGWLNSQDIRLKTFVANRINQILELTDVRQWHHVRSEDNPADAASRGLKPSDLLRSTLWWNGPKWLIEEEYAWKSEQPSLINCENLPEQRRIQLSLVTNISPVDIINVKSNWNQLIRSVAWLALFVDYMKSKGKMELPKYLTVVQLRRAEVILIKRVQLECFQKEITALENSNEVPRRSNIRGLYPFMQDGILLVGGRLQNSNLREQQKHPIVLPASHRLTRLIFESCHREMLHCGPQALLAQIRRRYWPLKGRVIARAVVKKCVVCTRAHPRFDEPLMAPLPKNRVQASRPFSTTGVDFAGPFIVRSGIRGRPGKRAWIAVFVCFITRAVHLEVVEDLSSSAFLACLKRFTSRRGRCAVIYSDNGTNFVGAERELASFIKNAGPAMAREGTEWKFIPPSSPHFGGIWEAAVKSAKHHLKRVMGETKLTISELNTLLCQIEACLNSRPITAIPSEPYELEALTPAHFLVGGPITLLPEIDLLKEAPGSLRRWKHVQYLLQHFWQRWHSEYLPQIQIRGKWTSLNRNLKENDLVIVKEDNIAPTKWKMARVIQLHPGSDGIVRVVTLRTTTNNEIKRPVVKLCLLPIENNEENVENIDFQRGENVGAEQ